MNGATKPETTMTANQIRKTLIAANIDMSTVIGIERDEVEVLVRDADGRTDHEATDAAVDAVVAVLGWSGRSTGNRSLFLWRR